MGGKKREQGASLMKFQVVLLSEIHDRGHGADAERAVGEKDQSGMQAGERAAGKLGAGFADIERGHESEHAHGKKTGLADRDYFLVAVVIYGISTVYSVFLWRKNFRQDNRICYAVLASGFVFHTIALVQRGFSFARCPVNNLYEAITFMLWTILASYLVLGLWQRLRFLGAFASPL